MAQTIKLDLLGKQSQPQQAKNLHESLMVIAALMRVTYVSKIALFILTCSAFVNSNLEYNIMETL
jgi:hypothetical protein